MCEVEEQLRNLGRGWVIVSFNFFEKVTLDPSLVPAPYVPHFSVGFEWLKTWWMHQVQFYKTSLYSKGKDAMIIDFKLKILIWFNSPILKHLTRLMPNIPYSIPSPNWAMFPTLEGLGEGLQMFVELQKQRNNVQGFDLLWVLKCSLTSLSTIKWKHLKTLLVCDLEMCHQMKSMCLFIWVY